MLNSFFKHLRLRRVFHTVAIYAIGAWLVLQVAETVFPALGVPDWAIRFVIEVFVIALGEHRRPGSCAILGEPGREVPRAIMVREPGGSLVLGMDGSLYSSQRIARMPPVRGKGINSCLVTRYVRCAGVDHISILLSTRLSRTRGD